MTALPSTTNAHVYEHSDKLNFFLHIKYTKVYKIKKDLTGTYKIDK